MRRLTCIVASARNANPVYSGTLEGKENIAIAAGSLDTTTGLRTIGHVWVSQAGNYYDITDDLPRFEKSHGGQLALKVNRSKGLNR